MNNAFTFEWVKENLPNLSPNAGLYFKMVGMSVKIN